MNTIVKSSKKLAKIRAANSALPSGQAVVPHSSMKTGLASFDSEAVKRCSLIFLVAISREWISRDVLSLAMGAAQQRAGEVGIEKSDEIFSELAKLMTVGRKSGMGGFLDKTGFF